MALAVKAFAWLVFAFAITALPLFLAAGTLAWPAGWIYLILLYGWDGVVVLENVGREGQMPKEIVVPALRI